MRSKLLIYSARQLVQVVNNYNHVVTGSDMKNIAIIEAKENEGISLVVSENGTIIDIGYDNEFRKKYKDHEFDAKIDATDMCILPGLIDAHTHPVWEGDRVKEFEMKLAGATYMDIHKAGGGIYFTVNKTREATSEQLELSLMKRLKEASRCGTTLLEAKSGYGLDLENEVKMLRVLEKAKKISPVEISSTYCGAHAVPKGKTSQEAAADIVSHQLPAIKKLMESGELQIENIDVFCEKGVYDIHQSRAILQAGKEMGLMINFHGDELNPVGAAEMGAGLEATAISHLEEVSDLGIEAMAKAGTVAVILPTTAYILRLQPPPVRRMIEAGVPVALGTDFNPNAFCLSMPLVMHLACILCHMTLPEALIASTINAAAALGKSKTHGSLEIGKMADIILISAPRWEHLVYQMGSQLIKYVIKKGEIVVKNF